MGFHFISPTTLGVVAPPGFRIRWGFFFIVDELATRFFLDESSSAGGGLDTKESIRPLRRREFVGNGGTGVVDLDSALRLLLDGSRVGFRRRVPLGLLGSFSGGFGYEAPGTRVVLGWTRNLVSLSPSRGRSSKPSSSVPSPNTFGRFGLLKTFMEPGTGAGVGGLGSWSDKEEGGRGISGEFDLDGGRLGKTADTGGRAFSREEEVGIVRRRAAGLEEGVEGRVGGTKYSKPWARLAVCDFAREEAVAVSYRL